MKATLGQITSFVGQYAEEKTYDRGLESMGSYGARIAYREVTRTYEAFASEAFPGSELSERKYRLGKRKGDGGPAQKPSAPGDTLRELGSFVRFYRTGLSASQTQSMGMSPHRSRSMTAGSVSGQSYIVEIDPSARVSKANKRYPEGIPARLMAYWTEFPRTTEVWETQRMLGYLMTLRRDKRGYGSPIKGPRKPKQGFRGAEQRAIVPSPKPVWNVAQRRLPTKTKLGLRRRSIIKLQKGPLKKALGGKLG